MDEQVEPTEGVELRLTPAELAHVTACAQSAGLSLQAYLRRAVMTALPAEDEALLQSLAAALRASTQQACAAVDEACAFVEESEARMAVMEAGRGRVH